MKMKSEREIQEARQRSFPKDRLAFSKKPKAASDDCASFRRYREEQITFEMLCAEVAQNNLLDQYFPFGIVPPKIMKNELRLTGWEKPWLL